MDSEHAVQIELLREVERAVAALDRTTALDLMRRLGDYSEAHFGSEQILMRLHAYPQYAAHEAEHGTLLAELRRVRDRLTFDDRTELTEAMQELRAWLLNHIQTSDRRFAEYIRGESLRRPHASDPS
jgi:hemerythrin-like metal-binding protein